MQALIANSIFSLLTSLPLHLLVYKIQYLSSAMIGVADFVQNTIGHSSVVSLSMVLGTHNQSSCENSIYEIPQAKQLLRFLLHVIPSCVIWSHEEPQSLFQGGIHPFVQCIHTVYNARLLATL